jgi:hypothetical protein
MDQPIESNSFTRALEAALNPTTPAPVATPEPAAPEPTPTPAADTPTPEPTPALQRETKPVVEKEKGPLKKGLDALDDEEETPVAKEAEPAEGDKDDTPPVDAVTPEAKNAWTKSRNEIREFKAKVTALEAEKTRLAAELEGKKGLTENDPLKAEVEALRKEREEFQKEAAKWNVTKTDAYRDAVTKPLNRLSTDALGIAKRNEINEGRLIDALREPDEKLQNEKITELTEALPEREKFRLWGIADELRKVYERQDEIEANAHESLKEAQAREQVEAAERQTKNRAAEMRAVEDMKDKLLKSARYFKLDGETDEVAVKAILEEANTVPFDEQDLKAKSFSVAAAAMLPRVLRNHRALAAKLAEAEKELASYVGATPRTTQGAVDKTPSGEPVDFVTAVKNRLAAAGVGV